MPEHPLNTSLPVAQTRLRIARQVVGWTAVGISTLVACVWAFWGIIENFHEGWWASSLVQNLGMLLGQYLAPMIVFIAVALVSTRWPYVGGGLHVALALFTWRFFSGLAAFQLITLPLALLGVCYWIGRPEPRKWTYRLIVTLPLLVMVVCGIEPAIRVMGRVDDGNREARLVPGNGVQLIWAPAGPGWPTSGVTWDEANRRCRHLTADGKSPADTTQDIWRLPTAGELVASLCRHGKNASGTWNAATGKAHYAIQPDKESPLWDTHSQVIYWWTSTEVDSDRALMVSFNGFVKTLPKKFAPGYLAFRAVKEPSQPASESH